MRNPPAPVWMPVHAELPPLGVALGELTADRVTVGVTTYSGRDEPHGIALVPVHRVEGGRFVLHRRLTPDDHGPARASDVGVDIDVRQEDGPPAPPTSPAASAARSAGLPRDSPSAIDNATLRSARTTLRGIARERWDGASGVLFLILYSLGARVDKNAPAPEKATALASNPDPDAIAAAIEHVLATKPLREIELATVPTSALLDGVDPAGPPGPIRFVLASCQYTLGMVDGTPPASDYGPRIAVPPPRFGPGDTSYARLADRIATAPAEAPVRFAILAGDQVYVDATAGLFDPTAATGRYRKPYEQFLGSPAVRDVQRRLRLFMVLDDHEIDDNWEADDWPAERFLKQGRKAYLEYQRGIDTLLLPPAPPPNEDPALWCARNIDGYDFFFADTRTCRTKRTAANGASPATSILGDAQFDALCTWLDAPANDGRPRFFVSASIFLPRHLHVAESKFASALQSDAWDGYRHSMERVLWEIAKRSLSNIVFLSGDEHLSCVSTATLRAERAPETATIRSIHCSGLYTPYRFANAQPSDFVDRDVFTMPRFDDPRRNLEWTVESRQVQGREGFCIVSVEPTAGAWRIALDFDLACGDGESIAI